MLQQERNKLLGVLENVGQGMNHVSPMEFPAFGTAGNSLSVGETVGDDPSAFV